MALFSENLGATERSSEKSVENIDFPLGLRIDSGSTRIIALSISEIAFKVNEEVTSDGTLAESGGAIMKKKEEIFSDWSHILTVAPVAERSSPN